MKKTWFISVLAGLFLCGCFETEQTISLNPDGSGKSIFKIIQAAEMGPIFDDNSIEEPDEAAQKTVGKIISESKGIDAWADVSYEILKDGRVCIKGTAYFKDYAKSELTSSGWTGKWEKGKNGIMTLTAVPIPGKTSSNLKKTSNNNDNDSENKDTKPEKTSDEEKRKRTLIGKMQYQHFRPLMVASIGSIKSKITFHLPGKIMNVDAFKQLNDGGLQIQYEGKKFIEGLDKFALDENAAEKALKNSFGELTVCDLLEGKVGDKVGGGMIWNAMFGWNKAPKVTVKGNLKPLFDYEKEASKAREAMPALMEKFKVEKVEDENEQETSETDTPVDTEDF